MKTSRFSHFLSCLFFSLCFTINPWVYAGELTPETIDGTTKITAEKLIDLVDEFTDLVMIDARITEDRDQGYIEGSISLPNTTTTCDSLAKHVKTKTTPTVYYCNGIKCGRSVASIGIAKKCGHTKIYWFRGGFEEWKAKGFPIVKD